MIAPETLPGDPMPSLDIKLADLAPRERYKALTAVVIPRPIALVTALMEDGRVNAAPHSFFNVFSEEPPLIVLGVALRPDRTKKDTTRLIQRNGEFVVNMVDASLAQRMNDCAIEFPPDVSEVEALGLETLPSVDIRTPRLAAAPFAYECRHKVTLEFTPERALMIGEPIRLHAREGLMDPETKRVDLASYNPVGRLFGELYSLQSAPFALERLSYEAWKSRRDHR
jgi:flavin reductase (DIM6/NTAB) family NADH-FMN oxidoreductase RutF